MDLQQPSITAITVLAGKAVKLACNITGFPVGIISWVIPAQVTTANNSSAVTISNSLLTITQVKPLHSGEYVCTYVSPAGRRNATFVLEVAHGGDNETSPLPIPTNITLTFHGVLLYVEWHLPHYIVSSQVEIVQSDGPGNHTHYINATDSAVAIDIESLDDVNTEQAGSVLVFYTRVRAIMEARVGAWSDIATAEYSVVEKNVRPKAGRQWRALDIAVMATILTCSLAVAVMIAVCGVFYCLCAEQKGECILHFLESHPICMQISLEDPKHIM